jgi:SAM-dependent methyltransferase
MVVELPLAVKVIGGAVAASGAYVSMVGFSLLTPALRKHCLPYVPATDVQLSNVSAALTRCPAGENRRVIDLGSGDGRVAIAAACLGFDSDGVELNPHLVLWSRLRARLTRRSYPPGVRMPRFYRRNLFKVDLSQYDVVTMFGTELLMSDLEEKLVRELRPGSYAVACRFPFPGLKATDTFGRGLDRAWLYRL